MQSWNIRCDRVEVGISAVGGQLDNVRFRTERGEIAPMHVAPWADEPLPDDLPPMLRMLRGDFFCAPFGASDMLPEEGRLHGTTANDTWKLIRSDPQCLELELARPLMGARVRKRVSVRPGNAAVYQEHEFTGGRGALPIGHHAMLRVPEPVYLGFSRWIWGGTPPTPLEMDPTVGRSRLAYPQTFDDLSRVRLATGGAADLSRFPALERHDDLLMLIADPALPLAWSAATAPRAGWVWFALRSPRTLSATVLWMSHGGRDYQPWSGRHTHVIGIEDVTAFFHLGHRASSSPNFLSEQGYPTAVELTPDRSLSVRYVFGLVAAPPDFGRVRTIEPAPGGIMLSDEAEKQVFAAIDVDFVKGPPARH